MKYKNNIKAFRLQKGLTQESLATKLDITTNYLSLLENGHREPSIELLKKVSSILDVPIPLLIMKVDSKSRNPIDKLLYETYKVAISINRKD